MADISVGGIEALIKLRDEMTGPLQRAEAELGRVTSAFAGPTAGADRASAALARAYNASGQFGTALTQQGHALDGLRAKLTTAETELTKTEQLFRANSDVVLKQKSAVDELKAAYQKQSTELDRSVKGLEQNITTIAKANPVLSNLTSMVLRFVGPMAIEMAVKRTMEWADNLEEMSQATGVSVTKLQQLEYAAKQNGTTFDNLITTIGQMSNRLASGDESAVGAIGKLGLGFESLQRMSPDEQMLAIGNALKGVSSAGERTAIAMDLFGRSGMRLLPTLLSLKETMAEAPKLGDEQVRSIAALNDAWDRLKTTGTVLIGEVLGPIADAFLAVTKAIKDTTTAAEKWGKAHENKPGTSSIFPQGLQFGADVPYSPVEFRQAQLEDARLRRLGPLVGQSLGLSQLTTAPGGVAGVRVTPGPLTQAEQDILAAEKKYAEELKKIHEDLTGATALRDLKAYATEITTLKQAYQVPEPAIKKLRDQIEATGRAAGWTAGQLQRALSQVRLPSTSLGISQLTTAPAGVSGINTSTLPLGSSPLGTLGDMGLIYAPFTDFLQGVKTSALELEPSVKKIDRSFDDLVEAFVSLAQIAGPSTSEFTKAIGTIMASLQLGQKAGEQIASGWASLTKEGGDKLKGTMGLIAGLISGAAAIYQSAQSSSRSANVASATMTGASVGWGAGGYAGAAVGAGVGALYGYLSKAPEKALNDLRDAYVDTAGGFDVLAKKAHDAGADLTALLKADNVKDYERAVRDLAAAFKVVDDRVKGTVSTLAKLTSDGGLIGAYTMQLIGKDKDKPEVQEALKEFLSAQTGKGVEGLQAFATNLQPGEITAGGAAGVGGAAAGLWGNLASQGMSLTDIVKEMGPSLAGLQAAFDAAGVSGGDAFKEIQSFASFAADEGVGKAITASEGLHSLLEATHNTGLLNQEMFAGLAEQVTKTYGNLELQGKGGVNALRAMQPSLQTIWELQQDFGYETDKSTGELIDQAKEAGLIGDKFRPAKDLMLEAIGKLIEKFDEFLDRLSGKLPTDAGAGVAGLINEFNKIPTTIDVDVRLKKRWLNGDDDDDNGGGGGGGGGGKERGMAEGGIVTRPIHALIGESGPEAVIPLSGRGPSGLGGDGGRVQIVIQAWDGASVDRWLREGGARQLAEATVPEIPHVLRAYGIR